MPHGVKLGTRWDDEFRFTENAKQSWVVGFDGNDTIIESFLAESKSDDSFFGNRGDDTIISFWGNDLIRAGKGDDIVTLAGEDVREAHGGMGHDTLIITLDMPHQQPGPVIEPDYPEHNHKGFEELIYM